MCNFVQNQALYSVLQHYIGEKIISVLVHEDGGLIFDTFSEKKGVINQDLNGNWNVIIGNKIVDIIEKDVFNLLVKPNKKNSLENYIHTLNSLILNKKISKRSKLLIYNIILFLENYIMNSEFLPKNNLRIGLFGIFNYNGKKFIYCLN